MDSVVTCAGDFERMLVPELKKYLMDRGITCSIYRRVALLRLCQTAFDLELDVVTTPDDYEDMDKSRRTVRINDKAITLKSMTEVDDWSSDLRKLPFIESYDVLIYLLKKSFWTEERLGNLKNDSGYKLFVANHITDVCIHLIPDTDFVYLKAYCIPETRQTESPYVTLALVRTDGFVHCAGCTCEVDNGTCKHCTALLFSLEEFSKRFKDRHTEVLHLRVNGGITRVALRSVKRSRMVKPLSAITSSPTRILSRKPEFSVINLSDVFPPHKSEIKEKAPEGVILTRTLKVLCDL